MTAGQDYLDRSAKIELVVPAAASSSSNAIACGAAMLLREAIEVNHYDWTRDGQTLPEAILKVMQQTGVEVSDAESGSTFRRLDLLKALDHVFQPFRKKTE